MTPCLKPWRAFSAVAREAHVSPLAYARWFPAWVRGQRDGASPMADESPWMTFPALAFLKEVLRPDMRVFEWGSGGSTLFFARRAKQVVTVEHNAEWAEKVRAACAAHSHVLIEHIPPDDVPPTADFDPTDPAAFFSSESTSFRRYATHIAAFPDAHFDLVVVDGRARPSCLQQAIPKLKPGGTLVLDDAERPCYARACSLLDAWPMKDFTGPCRYVAPFKQTVAWRKMTSAK